MRFGVSCNAINFDHFFLGGCPYHLNLHGASLEQSHLLVELRSTTLINKLRVQIRKRALENDAQPFRFFFLCDRDGTETATERVWRLNFN